MEIPNLAPSTQPTVPVKKSTPPILPFFIILILGLTTGFWMSRLFPSSKSGGISLGNNSSTPIPIENVSNKDEIQTGKLYGNSEKSFKDSAIGTIEKGSINGEGTHILKRAGGDDQRASLTSSTVDLDLFVGRKVEVKGETNSSNKTGWLLDVGTIKVIE